MEILELRPWDTTESIYFPSEVSWVTGGKVEKEVGSNVRVSDYVKLKYKIIYSKY